MTDMTNVEFIRDLAARMFRNATPAMGFDQGDTDRLYVIANRLAALEQAGEPVADALGDIQRFHKSYICLGGDDDGEEYVRWSDVLAALPTLQRLGQEFDAGEVKAYLYERGDSSFFEREMKPAEFYPNWKITPLYAHPPQSHVAADPVGLRDDEGKLVATARRNIRTFISAASFNSENDRQAAIACIDVLEDHMNGLGDLVAVLRSAFDAASSLATPAQPDPPISRAGVRRRGGGGCIGGGIIWIGSA